MIMTLAAVHNAVARFSREEDSGSFLSLGSQTYSADS
jgi:hypothetical protein